eukprot:GILI01003792.1.p1 GENE.GILI01003792.1~~GILI01003792.1.p1  ORF type:complete len:344 (+),score=23.22 GILI01003792.1:361-1392(+)
MPQYDFDFSFGVFERGVERGVELETLAYMFQQSTRTAKRWASKKPESRGRKPKTEVIAARARTAYRIARRKKYSDGKRQPEHPTPKRIAKVLREEFQIQVSPHTVRRDLKSLGVHAYVRPRHPNLRNAKNRLAFAKLWLSKGNHASRLVFTDEHYISTNDNGSRTMMCKQGEYPEPREVQRRQNVPSLMLWGAIGLGWKSDLVFFPRFDPDDPKRRYSLNGPRYIQNCLKPNITKLRGRCEAGKRIFMQDGARCHWSGEVLGYLSAQKVDVLRGFPASSPDFNPIESVWSALNTRIAEYMPHDDESLVLAAKKAWESLTQAEIDRFVLKFVKNLEFSVLKGGR